jgi:hypothetical protein
MEICVYTLEDRDGNEQSWHTQDYSEAQALAQRDHLKVICNEFEFSDSYLVDDFTIEEEK